MMPSDCCRLCRGFGYCVCLLLVLFTLFGLVAASAGMKDETTSQMTLAKSLEETSGEHQFYSLGMQWSEMANFSTAAPLFFAKHLNASLSPCSNFFEFTCGDAHADSENDISFARNVMEIVEELQSPPAKNEIEPLVNARRYFKKCVAHAGGKERASHRGLLERKYRDFLSDTQLPTTLFDENVQEERWPSPASLGKAIGMLAADGVGSLLSVRVIPDWEENGTDNYSGVYRLHLGEMKLTFPLVFYYDSTFTDDLCPKLVEDVLEAFAEELGINVTAKTISAARKSIVHFENLMRDELVKIHLAEGDEEDNLINVSTAQQLYYSSSVVDLAALVDVWRTQGMTNAAHNEGVPIFDVAKVDKRYLRLLALLSFRDGDYIGLTSSHLTNWLLWRHVWANAEHLLALKPAGLALCVKGDGDQYPYSRVHLPDCYKDTVLLEGKWRIDRSALSCTHDLITLGRPLAERLLVEHIHPKADGLRARIYDGVRRMFRLQLGKYRVALRRTHWLSPEMKRFALEGTRKLKIHLAASPLAMNDSLLTAHYAGWHLNSTGAGEVESFNVIREKLRRHKHSQEVAKLSSAQIPDHSLAWEFFRKSILHNPSAGYIGAADAVYIPVNYIRPPIYHPDWPAAANYGALGRVIGHEISHQLAILLHLLSKSAYDKDRIDASNLVKCLIDEYSNFCPLHDACVNGRQTMMENMADIAGLQLAFAGYRRETTLANRDWATFNVSFVVASNSISSNHSDHQMMFDQLFFTAFGRYACTEASEETDTRQQLVDDPHSPYRYRLQGSLRNFVYFSRAYECSRTAVENSEQQPYNPTGEHRCQLWKIL